MSFKAALYRLSDATELVPLEDKAFWSAYWTLPVSADTIFSSVSSNDIRYIRDSNLGNFCNLLRALSFHVIHLASKKSVPLNVFPTKELLTSVRILTKLMPYLYEMETLIPVEREIFWTLNNAPASLVKADSPADCTSTSATVGTASPGLSSSDDPSSSDSTKVNVDFKQKSSSSNESTKARFDNQTASQLHPLGPQLILAAINLLFTAGFTTPLPDGVDSASYAMNNVDFTLWEDGIGSQTVASGSAGSQYEPPSIDLDTHRLELIRLLLSLCSQCVYETVPTIVAEGSPFLSFLVSSVPKLQLLALLSSLINVACRSARTNSTSITNENGLIFEIADYRELRSLFVANSMQLLCLMLIYPLPKQHAKYVSGTSNLARYYCGRIYKIEEVVLLAEGFLRPLIRPISPDPNSSTFSNWMKSKLAASNTAVWNTEQIVLFWEFYQCNKRFRTFLAAKYAPRLILALLYNVWVFKNEKKQAQLCPFVALLDAFLEFRALHLQAAADTDRCTILQRSSTEFQALSPSNNVQGLSGEPDWQHPVLGLHEVAFPDARTARIRLHPAGDVVHAEKRGHHAKPPFFAKRTLGRLVSTARTFVCGLLECHPDDKPALGHPLFGKRRFQALGLASISH